MQTMTATQPAIERISQRDTSFEIKKRLKATFPKVKFSVTSHGSAVTVRWTGGPKRESVEAISKPFQGMGFDGMTDSTFYYDHTIEVNGVTMKPGYVYVFVERTISDEVMAATKIKVMKYWGIEASQLNSAGDCRVGNDWLVNLVWREAMAADEGSI